jgi:hypothetical protein
MKHLTVSSKTAAIHILQGLGIEGNEKQWDEAVFVRDRRHSGKIMTAELQVTVKVNSALKHSLGQHINMEGSRETAFIEVARVAERDKVTPTATLAPRSDKQRYQLLAWRRLWRLLGATEQQILEIINFMVEVAVPGWIPDTVTMTG